MRSKLVRMSWSTRLTLVAAVALTGLIITVAIALDTLRAVQIRGVLYEEIRLAQDLRADILPSPNYLVDATAHVATASVYALRGEFAKAQAEMQRYEQARRDYFARYEFWQKHLQEPELRKTLLQEAHPPAVQIFALVEREFKPALARGDRRAVERAYAQIHQLFQRHKAAIDRAVVQLEAWAKRVEAHADTIKQARTKLLWSVTLVVLALVAYGSFVLFRMGKSLTNATKQLHSAIQHLQQGDLLYRIPVSGNDEMAQLLTAYNKATEYLAQAFTETRQAAKLVLQGVQGFTEGLNTVAQGAHAVGTTVAESARGAESLAHELQRINESVSQVQLAAQEVAQGAEQTAQSAAAGVERVNLITQRIQTAFAELQQVQHQSEQASQITHEGRIALQRSEQVMREIEAQTRRTAQELQQLAEMSNSVSKIVSKIEDIARQINLLSLNAAIEAARAGEAGRGFAVVADEVRRLAERSALSSQEIQQILEQVVEKTHEAVAAMEESLKVVQEGGAVSQQVAAGLQAILQAVDLIAEQVRHSAQLMQEVQLSSEATLSEIEQIAAIAEQSSAASEQMLASAETTAHALQQMAALSEQAAANAQQSSHIVQQQVAAIQQLNQNASEASATVERLMFSLGRFRVSDEESFEEKIATFKRAHLKWVERVERMVHHGEMIPRDQLVSHQKCALGTWYYSIGQQMYGHLPEFRAIEPPHERLHQIAAQAVEAVERGDRARAEQLLEEIRSVSTEIVSWLDKLYARVTTSELRQAA